MFIGYAIPDARFEKCAANFDSMRVTSRDVMAANVQTKAHSLPMFHKHKHKKLIFAYTHINKQTNKNPQPNFHLQMHKSKAYGGNTQNTKGRKMEHFADKDPEYFLKGIEMLVHRCEKCVEVKGDFIEK